MVVHVFSVLALWLLVSAVGLITFSALAEEHVKQFGNERYRNMQQLSSLQHRRSLVSEVATTSLFDHRTEQNHSQVTSLLFFLLLFFVLPLALCSLSFFLICSAVAFSVSDGISVHSIVSR